MSKWFPDVAEYEGAQEALKGGIFGGLAFAAMNALGIVLLLATDKMPSTGDVVTEQTGAIVGILIEMSIGLIAAWRFKNEKGLIWGAFVAVIFAFEIFAKIVSGTTNIGWLIAYAAIFVAIINGIRGAWAMRSNNFKDADVFS